MQIRDYIIRRLLILPVLIFGVSVVVFTLTRIGGSPIGVYLSHEMNAEEVAALEERFHLNEPLVVQYWYWAKGALSGDFGYSGVAAAPVSEVFWTKFAATMELSVFSALIAVWLGLKLGGLCREKTEPLARSSDPDRRRLWRVAPAFLVWDRVADRVLGKPRLVPGGTIRRRCLGLDCPPDRLLYSGRFAGLELLRVP